MTSTAGVTPYSSDILSGIFYMPGDKIQYMGPWFLSSHSKDLKRVHHNGIGNLSKILSIPLPKYEMPIFVYHKEISYAENIQTCMIVCNKKILFQNQFGVDLQIDD